MPTSDKTGKAIRYWLNRKIRAGIMGLLQGFAPSASTAPVDLRRANIQKILLVRSMFRMGDSILVTPAIFLMHKNFLQAKIGFVGPPVAKALFQILPMEHCYAVFQSFPKVCWSYLLLLKQIRAAKYDFALDVSGSTSALGAFIIGFSAARWRAGMRGKWERWFDLRLSKPVNKSQYANMPELVAARGLDSEPMFPKLVLTAAENAQGRKRMEGLVAQGESRIVGVFVGGRKSRGKGWEKEKFPDLAIRLLVESARPIIFVGPEERKLLPYFSAALSPRVAVVCEPDARAFAGLVANCDLFIACDSGPIHLACALGIRTVAIFLNNNFSHWGLPPELARIVYREQVATVDMVESACREELALLSQSGPAAGGRAANDATAMAAARG